MCSISMYVCKDLAAPAHVHTRAHRPAAPRQSSAACRTDITSHGLLVRRHGIPHRQTTIGIGIGRVDRHRLRLPIMLVGVECLPADKPWNVDVWCL